MGMLMIKCPSTGKYVPTGIVMDRSSFETCRLENNAVHCPECSEVHTWGSADARLIEEMPAR